MRPDWTQYVRLRLPALNLRPEREQDVIAELAEELGQAYQEALDSGLDAEAAMRRAESRVKDWKLLANELRAANRPALPEIEPPRRESIWSCIRHDARYSLRMLRLNPGFAAIAILALGFGIGGNTAIFTVVDHIALRGLPYPDADRMISLEHTKNGQPEIDPWCSIDNLFDFRQRSRSLESLVGVSPLWNVVLNGNGFADRLETLFVSREFFPVLGVQPAVGRVFMAEEDDRVHPVRVAILSHSLWTRRFGRAADIVGKTATIDGAGYTIVGVLPESFRWRGEPLAGTASNIDIWMPLSSNPLARSPRTLRFLKPFGRVKPGYSMRQAQDEVAAIGGRLTTEFPAANGDMSFAGVPLESKITGRFRPAVYLLLATVGFVLLMASANLASLLLARAASRGRELSIRVALGASGGRLLSQLLVESAVLALFGGVLGLALAHGFVRLIVNYGPPSALSIANIGLDWRALSFTGAVVILTAILSGVIPAYRAIAGTVEAASVRSGHGTTRNSRAARAFLTTAQVAIALCLLIGSGLLIRSFVRVLSIDPGFDAGNITSISTLLPSSSTAEQRTMIYNAIRDRLLALPGVTSVGAVSRLPMLGQNLSSLLILEGRETEKHPPEVEFRAATPSYFPTMGIPLIAGRLFDDRDPPTMRDLIIDELTAKRHFAGVDPVGKRIRFLADQSGPWYTIVGVVGSIRHFGLEADPRPTIYRSVVINPLSAPVLVIRTASDPISLTRQLTETVRSVNAELPAYNVYAMEQLVANSTAERRFLMWLITAFAISALLLAGIGIYGAISQSVAQRTQEIGVRLALGASTASVIKLIFVECMQLGGAGMVAGVALGLIGARLGQQLLYQVQPYDLPVLFGALATIVIFGALACYIPARRAMRVDPVIALRDE